MMACHSLHVPLEGDGEAKAYEHVTAHYSPDLKKLLGFFLSNTSRLRHINDIMPIIGARFYAHIDALETRNDVVEIEAGKEIQNGRSVGNRAVTPIASVARGWAGVTKNW